MAEGGIDDVLAVGVADAADRLSLRMHPELAQSPNGSGHQALAARLVDGAGACVEHQSTQPGARGIQGCGQSGRSGPRDDEVGVDHRDTAAGGGAASARACANATFSDAMRSRSSPALTTVKAIAVTQAVCTNGSAMPSSTTAT